MAVVKIISKLKHSNTTINNAAIHADGFAEGLEECGICGALWSQGKGEIRLLHGATWAA